MRRRWLAGAFVACFAAPRTAVAEPYLFAHPRAVLISVHDDPERRQGASDLHAGAGILAGGGYAVDRSFPFHLGFDAAFLVSGHGGHPPMASVGIVSGLSTGVELGIKQNALSFDFTPSIRVGYGLLADRTGDRSRFLINTQLFAGIRQIFPDWSLTYGGVGGADIYLARELEATGITVGLHIGYWFGAH